MSDGRTTALIEPPLDSINRAFGKLQLPSGGYQQFFPKLRAVVELGPEIHFIARQLGVKTIANMGDIVYETVVDTAELSMGMGMSVDETGDLITVDGEKSAADQGPQSRGSFGPLACAEQRGILTMGVKLSWLPGDLGTIFSLG